MARNHGIRIENPRPKDWSFGGVTGTADLILAPDGQWDKWLPEKERQNMYGLETMSCVSASYTNVIETIFRQRGLNRNFSERWLAKRAGTAFWGNTLRSVASTAQTVGLVEESSWPWPPTADTWARYYCDTPPELDAEAARFLDLWELTWEWGNPIPERMMESLKRSPLQACSEIHAFEIYGYDEGKSWKRFDSYGNCIDTLPWDFPFVAVMLHHVNKAEPEKPMITLPENSLVIVTDGLGERLMHVNGKMYQDDAGKILLEVTARNAKAGMSGPIPVVHVRSAEVADFPRFNLKNQPL